MHSSDFITTEDLELITVKNLLAGRTCDNCDRKGSAGSLNHCMQYMGEAIGWQWWTMNKEGTCDSWKEKD